MWVAIFGAMSVIAVLSAIFLVSRALRFGFPKYLYGKNKILGIISALWPLAICVPFLLVSKFAFIIAFIHLFLFWVLTDFAVWIFRKLAKRGRPQRYVNGFVALGLTVVYLTYGWIMAHYVYQTDYLIETEKSLPDGGLRVVAIADLHVGVTLDGDEFAEQCERINELSPDLVVVCGDFVDDDSSHEDMLKACDALGTLDTTYGVFYVFGNHDRGYFRRGTFTMDDFSQRLEQNNVRILTDSTAIITEDVYLVGREDASKRDRTSPEELTSEIDPSKYVIMLDHQPNDYDAIEKSGADLVISGHTHGGHVFPAGQIGMLMGANDALYGLEQRGDTSFIVSSGISGWAIPFKTFAISEFVVIDIKNKV